MDEGFVPAEGSRRRDDPPSRSARSPSFPIKSIAIDLNCEMEEEIPSPKHEHFSILGYVSEMRKIDKKACLPFASEGGDIDMNLPPLSVPNFRWWQCSGCVPDVLDQKSTLGMIHSDNSDAGTNSFLKVGGKDTLLLQNIGDEHGSRGSRDGDYNYASDKLIDINPEGHKSTTTYVWNKEGGNSFPHKPTEVNQMKEITHNNSAAKNPSTRPHEPAKASSPSDDDIAFSSLPSKRKRKLRSLADIIKEDKNLLPTQPIEDDLDAPKGVAKTPHRKRKMLLEEEEEEEEIVPPIAVAKKLKGPVTESENNTRNTTKNNNSNNTINRVEISDSDSEKGNSRPTLFGSRLSAKTNQNKARKQRSIDINRKARRADTENRTFGQMVNLQKYPLVAAGTNFGGTGSFFNNSLFGQQMDSIHDKSIGKKKVEEGHSSPYIPPSNKDGLGVSNNKIQEKVTLDLSLGSYTGGGMNLEKQESSGRYTGIPDLNESFVEKMSMTEDLQLPSFPEKALHTNLDMFATSNKKTDNNTTVVAERGGGSDDIPMEIVELLAKNQHERALDNSKKHPRPNGFHNTNHFKVPPPYIEGTPCAFKFPDTNSRSGGLSGSGGTMGFLSLPPQNCHSDNGQFRQSSSPLMPGQHRIGLSSGPKIVSGLRPSNGADLLWPPRRKNVTFNLGLPSGSEDQTNKGKNVQMAVTDGALVREGGIRLGSKPVGSMDAYSNEAIPAMQLLSLMDQRIITGSSQKVGNFLDRQFSPCNQPPRTINKNHNQNDPSIGSSSFLGQSSRANDFPALLYGARYSGDSSSKKSFPQGRMPPLKGNSKPIDLAGPGNLSAQPSSSDLMLEVCTLNRNPADFSIPDARNEYMISAKDLNPKKRYPAKEKSRPAGKVEGPKKQRARKDSSRK